MHPRKSDLCSSCSEESLYLHFLKIFRIKTSFTTKIPIIFSKNGSHLMRNKTFYEEVLLHMKSGLEDNPTYDVKIPLKQGWRSI